MKQSIQTISPCQTANDQLIELLANEQLDDHSFNTLCKEHPDCKESLVEIKNAWEELGNIEIPSPSVQMQDRFYNTLQSFEAELNKPSTNFGLSSFLLWVNPFANLAFMSVLFIVGIGIGYWINSNSLYSAPQVRLDHSLQEQTFVALKNDNSVSERLKGVQMVRQLENPNEVIIKALNKALLYDPNVNVRLSAIESMLFFADNPKVRTNLIQAIPLQTSPLVQLALAEAMLILQEKSAIDELELLINSDNVELEVKMELEETVRTLL